MATRTVANGGGNYNATGTWVEAAVPTNADDVVFTASSGTLTINVASAAKSVSFANGLGTVNGTNTWTIGNGTSGANITLNSSITYGGTWTLAQNTSGTFTFNGVTFARAFTTSGTITITLADNGTLSGAVTLAGTVTINQTDASHGNTLTFNGSTGGSWGTISGSTKLVFGAMTFSNTVTLISNNIDITAGGGTFTLSSTSFIYQTGTITYISGTCITTGSTIKLGNSCTLNLSSSNSNSTTNSSGCNLSNFNWVTTVTQTTTLSSNLAVVGTFTSPANINATLSGFNLYLGGNITCATNSTIQGTTVIQYIGTGTWSGGATCDLYYLNFTYCVASVSTIWVMHGTLSNTTNINNLTKTNPSNVGYISIN